MVFDRSKPAVTAIKSTFGGGWVVPLNDDGRRVLLEYYGKQPVGIAPLGGLLGYIVEPQDADALADYLHSEKITWEVGL